MTMTATRTDPIVLSGAAAEAKLAEVRASLLADRLVPYLGPDLLVGDDGVAPIPTTPEAVAAALNGKAPSPSRIRTSMWSVAQFIEQRRHRKTLTAWMAEIFTAPIAPPKLLAFLAAQPLSLVVDTWYDSTFRAALEGTGRSDWIEIQGVTRAGESRDIWFKAYDPAGLEVLPEVAETAKTILYKPHGGILPAKNFLVADSDYVEVLTEIDIQSPIPEMVKRLRTERGFLFLGCRFHDQMLRIYAKQITKRSAGGHVAVVDVAKATKNEMRFYADMGVTVLDLPLARASEILVG
jgi:hypothetical protein